MGQANGDPTEGGAGEATRLALLLGAGWFSAVALGARLVTGEMAIKMREEIRRFPAPPKGVPSLLVYTGKSQLEWG